MDMRENTLLEQQLPGFNEAFNTLHYNQLFKLSRRESEVLILLSKDISVCKIAGILCREKTTVYKHIENAMAKMKCNSLLSLGIKLSYFLK